MYNEKNLEDDMRDHKKRTDRQYRLQKIAEKKAIRDNAIENGADIPDDNDYLAPVVTERELEIKGCKMMLEALYNIYYEPFDWDRLRKDLFYSKYDLDEGYNEDTPEEVDRAREDIKDFRNYIGARKKISPTNKMP